MAEFQEIGLVERQIGRLALSLRGRMTLAKFPAITGLSILFLKDNSFLPFVPSKSPLQTHLTMVMAYIERYLSGESVDFSSLSIEITGRSPFFTQVITTARTLARGEIVSYSDLATRSGYPKAVRAVASVMRNNPLPLIIPCHRVIPIRGGIGGYLGEQSGDAVIFKRVLIDRENLTK